MSADKWDARLENWALWKVGGDDSTSQSRAYRTGRNMEWWTLPPRKPQALVGDAIDVDRLIKRLDPDHQEAIAVVYLWTYPETLEDRAKELRPPITRKTLYNRLEAAKQLLEELDGERTREAVKRLAAVAR